jgi:hypothetical protein
MDLVNPHSVAGLSAGGFEVGSMRANTRIDKKGVGKVPFSVDSGSPLHPSAVMQTETAREMWAGGHNGRLCKSSKGCQVAVVQGRMT